MNGLDDLGESKKQKKKKKDLYKRKKDSKIKKKSPGPEGPTVKRRKRTGHSG